MPSCEKLNNSKGVADLVMISMNRILRPSKYIAVALAIGLLALYCWRAVKVFDRLFRPGALTDTEIEHLRKKGPPGFPVFTDADPFEKMVIDGIEFKIYTSADGTKHYSGPIGSTLYRALDGTPIAASFDQNKADATKAKMEDHISRTRKVMEGENRLQKPVENENP